MLSEEENAFDYFNLAGTIISRDEAFKLLNQVEEDGLVHTTFYNVKERFNAICNCCPCCCGVIRAVKEFNAPHIMAKSNFSASIDEEICDSCGICAQERCPMDAITESDGAYRVSREKCIGCGVCTVACKTGAIKLIRKPDDEHVVPPDNLIVWMQKRAENRGTQAKI